MNKFSLVKIIVLFIVAIAFLLGCVFPLSWVARNLIYEQSHKDDWRETTTPLNTEILIDICVRFDITEHDHLCNSSNPIYAPDLFPHISEYIETRNSNYNEVQLLLGNYQSDLEPKVLLGNGEEYFRSWYDLNGDGKTALVIFFHGDGQFMRIHYFIEDSAYN